MANELSGRVDGDRIVVDWSGDPFAEAGAGRFDAAGKRIDEIEREARAQFGEEFAELEIFVGGAAVPKGWRHLVTVKPGQRVRIFAAVRGSTFRLIAGVLLAAAIAAFAPYLAGVIAPGLMAAGGVGAGLLVGGITAGLTLAGTLAMNALFPPPKIAPPPRGIGSSPAISGIGNKLRPDGVVPELVGKFRVYPDYATAPYYETEADNQFVNALFLVSIDDVTVADMKIGETSLDEFDGVETEIIRNTVAPKPEKFRRVAYEEAQGVTLEKDVQHVRNTVADASAFTVELELPGGAFQITKKGKRREWRVLVKVEYRPAAGGAWTVVAGNNPAEYPDELEIFTKQEETIRRAVRVELPSAGEYEVRVTKTSDGQAEEPDLTIIADIRWSSLRSFRRDDVISAPYPVTAIALRIKASDQLSGQLEAFNVIAERVGWRYNGAAWELGESDNLADVYVTLLKSSALARPRTDDEIDYTRIEAFRARCEAMDFRANQWRDYRATLFEAANELLAVGRARVDFRNGKWGVMWDEGDAAPIAHRFHPGNIGDVERVQSLDDLPHALRVTFPNRDEGYRVDEVIAYADGYTAANAIRIEDIQYPGIDRPDPAWQRARYDLRQGRLQRRQIRFFLNRQMHLTAAGDRAELTYPVLAGIGGGWVRAVAGASITLDADITLEAGSAYQLRFTHIADGSATTAQIVTGAGTWRTVTIDAAIGALAVGDGYAFGKLDDVVERVVISKVETKGSGAMVTVFPEPAADPGDDPVAPPNFVSSLPVAVADYDVPPQSVGATQVLSPAPAGVRADIVVAWRFSGLVEVAEVAARWRRTDVADDWDRIALPLTERLTVADVPDGTYEYQIATRAAGRAQFSRWSASAIVVVDAEGGVPNDLAAVLATPNLARGEITFTATPAVDPRRSHFVLRRTPLTAGATRLDAAIEIEVFQFPITVRLRPGTYFVDAVSWFGVESVNPASYVVAEFFGDAIDYVEEIEIGGANGWAGVHDDTLEDATFLRLGYSSDAFAHVDAFAEANIFGDIAGEGRFTPSASFNFGKAFDVEFDARVEATALRETEDAFDHADIFALENAFGDVDPAEYAVAIEIRTTTDDPTGAPTWTAWGPLTGETVQAWGGELRFHLQSFEPTVTPQITAASFLADLPEREERGHDVNVASGGLIVTYAKPFYQIIAGPLINVQGGSDGDPPPRISAATTSGFTVHCVDKNEVAVARVIDWRTVGLGRDQT